MPHVLKPLTGHRATSAAARFMQPIGRQRKRMNDEQLLKA
jgi:hypothetical protein